MKKRMIALICMSVLLMGMLSACKQQKEPMEEVLAGNEGVEVVPESQEPIKEETPMEDPEELTPEASVPSEEEGGEETIVENAPTVEESSVEGTLEDPVLALPADPEDKFYCNATLEDDFEPGIVDISLTKKVSDPYKRWADEVFGCVEFETIKLSTLIPSDGACYYDLENFHQQYTIVLKEKTKEAVLEAIKKLESLDYISSASPSFIIEFDPEIPGEVKNDTNKVDQLSAVSSAVPNVQSGRVFKDRFTAQQYAINKMFLPAAWHITTGEIETIQVAVMDSGVDFSHDDIRDYGDSWGIDYTSDKETYGTGSSFWDQTGHGTHVAGIIGAEGNNNDGITGVAWNISLASVKVFETEVKTDGTLKNVTNSSILKNAINYCGSKNVKIINFSGGDATINNVVNTELNNAINSFPGLFITSAGNDGNNNDIIPYYPCNYSSDKIIAVAAVDGNDQLWEDSNYGATTVDLTAPGYQIYSTVPDNDYALWSGTSMAAPQVAGVAALIWSINPSLTAAQVKSAIMNGVDPVSGLSGKCVTGGRINALKALANSMTSHTMDAMIGDVDGDGCDDLVIPASYHGNLKLSVVRGTSNGMFLRSEDLFTTDIFRTAVSYFLKDVNGDGKDDVIVHYASGEKRQLMVYTAKGDGSFYAGVLLSSVRTHSDEYPCSLFSDDVTGDGKADFIVHWRNGSGKRCIMVYKGISSGGKGTFQEGMYSLTSTYNYVHTDPVYVGDVNGDGRADLVVHWQSNNKRQLLTFTANTDGTFSAGINLSSARTHNPSVYPSKLYLADATGDGKNDFIVHWRDTNGKRNIMIYKGIAYNGVAHFEDGYYALNSTRSYVEADPVYTGDVNGDGRADMLVYWNSGGYRQVLVYYANSSGNYNEAVNTATDELYDPTTYPNTRHIMDANGDGKMDFVVRWRRPDLCTSIHNYSGTTSSGVSQATATQLQMFPYYAYW